jgi:hypothetical protein
MRVIAHRQGRTPQPSPGRPHASRPRRLGLWYRVGWRLNYMILSAYGPAELGGTGQPDPRVQMRQARAERVLALRPATLGPAAPRPALR